jgi:hypothetical protein
VNFSYIPKLGILGCDNKAMKKCDGLLQRKQHIDVVYNVISKETKKAYLTRLIGSIDCARYLVNQGLYFRGHGESNESYNKGNIRELHEFTEEQNPTLRNATSEAKSYNSLLWLLKSKVPLWSVLQRKFYIIF